MSNIRSIDKMPVQSMRWVARLLSIPWAFWATFWTGFVLAHPFAEAESDFLLEVVFPIVMIPIALMYFGAAIIASVWGKETFGGALLLADGVLILAGIIVAAFLTGEPMRFLLILGSLGSITMVLPPLVAGYLFRECHRRSKKSAEQP
jgi:hypothetical protein